MNKRNMKSMDGNTASAHIAYAFSEVCALYPITPSTTMGEVVDEWSAKDKISLFGKPVVVAEMQSEAGAAGAIHGALSAGAFCSTFTASQGLLLMIPNMYKIAGELLPVVFHVTARALAGHALCIFGDHQDVMAARPTGFSFLCSDSVQEAMDLALVAHLSTLRASLPFVHFFDGFRTSHEIQKIDEIQYEDIKDLVDWDAIKRHRERALNPNHPYVKGSAQNPDIYFQAIEGSNTLYQKVPKIVEEEMEKVSKLTGRKYRLFDYYGDKDADRIIIMMGSGSQVAEEAIDYLNARGEKVGIVKVRLFRPFSRDHLLKAIPKSAKKIAVLERTKEVTAFGEPLYLDVCAVLEQAGIEKLVVGGRYGLGSKDFTPSMVKAVFDNLNLKEPKNSFTVGIVDDVTYKSLVVKEKIETEPKGVVRCKFWGLGGDGTVGANKEAIKIIGDNTDKYVQGYFSYDSKKSFGITISHLRFGDEPIKSSYLIDTVDYIACHESSFVNKYNVLEGLVESGVFVLNSLWTLDDLEKHLPNSMKKTIAVKKIKFYNVNAVKVATDVGLGRKTNMVMQTAFFKLANVLPMEKAIEYLYQAIEKAYGKKGEETVNKNKEAVKRALDELKEVKYPSSWKDLPDDKKPEDLSRPEFVRNVADIMNRQEGDSLPVSALAPGGVFPMGSTQYEKRGFATNLPKWIPENCIQCGQCSFVCPHAVIRPCLITKEESAKAPEGYDGVKAIGKGMENYFFSIEVSSFDCTGCGNCVEVCPAPKGKALVMSPKEEWEEIEARRFEYATKIPYKKSELSKYTLKGSQLRKPLFEFSGACAGCGETPYVKLVTQLFGERMIVANATGCSSIYGASAPSMPWNVTDKGCGPAWANSLFEDNAEYGFGMHLATKSRREELKLIVHEALKENIANKELYLLLEEWLKNADEGDLTEELAEKIIPLLAKESRSPLLEKIYQRKDILVKLSIWIIGGDGWAYDIGYGGLDHVIAMGEDVNILVLDTEVYSNTGGQASKSTPLSSIAKFASMGKRTMKKDLGLMAMSYGSVYVASVAMGADKNQLVKAFKEAESYKGPSIILAYSSCINHGIKEGMLKSQEQAKKAVEVGYWFNYRFDPRLKETGKNPFQLDSKAPTGELESFLDGQVRYNYLKRTKPEEAKRLHGDLKKFLDQKYKFYKDLSEKQEG